MKKKRPTTKTKKKKGPERIVFNFDSIRLNNPQLLNDQSLNVAYQKFLLEIDDSFKTLFNL